MSLTDFFLGASVCTLADSAFALADSRFVRASIFLAFALSLATLISAFALILAFLIRSFWAGVSLFLRFLLPPFSARSRYLAERDFRTPHFMPLTPWCIRRSEERRVGKECGTAW